MSSESRIPRRLGPDSPDLVGALALIRESFAYMDGRIDPPSSIHRLTLDALTRQSVTAEVWVIGNPVEATVVLTPQDDSLYIGKLAVAAPLRRRGHARHLIELAEHRARVLALPWLELQVRVELVDNQQGFSRLGFSETRRTTHAGFDRPTSITMRKPV